MLLENGPNCNEDKNFFDLLRCISTFMKSFVLLFACVLLATGVAMSGCTSTQAGTSQPQPPAGAVQTISAKVIPTPIPGADPIVGKWYLGGGDAYYDAKFKSDYTFTLALKLPYAGKPGYNTFDGAGTWKIVDAANNKYTLSFTKGDWGDGTPRGDQGIVIYTSTIIRDPVQDVIFSPQGEALPFLKDKVPRSK